MLVSGVRRSWECPQQVRPHLFLSARFINIFSRSASTRACVFMLLVMALVMLEIGYHCHEGNRILAIVKSSAAHGCVNRKLTQANKENRPKLYPSVNALPKDRQNVC